MEYLYIFLINWALNILLVEFLVIKKLKNVIKVDEKRDSKYAPFRRLEVRFFKRRYLYPTCHFVLVKLITVFTVIFSCAFLSKIVMLGMKEGETTRGWRRFANRWIVATFCRVTIWGAGGALWVNYSRPKVCYKKYLGPDWKADYDGHRVGTVICNHSAFLDSMVHGIC